MRSVLGVHWKDWCWSWNSNTLATWCKGLPHLKRPWCWERLRAGGEGDNRGWDGWMASPTQWTWVWVDSGSWWWTGSPGMLQFMGLQRVRHDWVTELNWTEPLDHSSPENLMNCMVHGVSKSQTRLSNFHFRAAAIENSMVHWCQASFHMPVGHSHIFFGEMWNTRFPSTFSRLLGVERHWWQWVQGAVVPSWFWFSNPCWGCRESLCTVGGNLKPFSCYRKQYGNFSEI